MESTGTTLFLLPDSCQHSAAPTRGELGKNEDRGWSETIHSALIVHAHFHESTEKGGIEYRKRYQLSWFCIIGLFVVLRTESKVRHLNKAYRGCPTTCYAASPT